ncbi:histidine kinase [Flavobacterium sp. MAH-1]|uniref:Histidine kinase n=1 Tax=Flavobacterium agri TaxID=2743471 RepID=A0A7Y9C4W3_9FLAO|nr:histidine kinase [Flavobacterium agri]NUY79744.1 histidine kinase [Flavobacterium agri]NYA69769.1 histidine kinase [Flavobacterium agri]
MKSLRLFLSLWLIPLAISALIMFLEGGFSDHLNWPAMLMVACILGIPAVGVAFVLPVFESKIGKRFASVALTAFAMGLVSMLSTGIFFYATGNDDKPELPVFQGIFCICFFLTEVFLTRIRFTKSQASLFTFVLTPKFALRLLFWVALPESVFCSVLLLYEFPTDPTISGYMLFILWIVTYSILTNAVALFAIWIGSRIDFLAKRTLLVILLATALTLLTGLVMVQPWQSQITIGILMTLLFPSLFSASALLFLVRQKAESEAKDYKLRSLGKSLVNKQSEYDQLKRHVNPHFFFNNLNMLISLIESDPKKASEFGQRLSNVYRKFFSENDEDFIALWKELDFISEYIEIYRAKFGDSFSIEIKPENPVNYHILTDALQEIVDNIFKHNIFEDENPIAIEIFRDDMNLVIRNSRVPKIAVDSEKTGLENIRKRYELLTDERISVSQTDRIFVVNLPILSFE